MTDSPGLEGSWEMGFTAPEPQTLSSAWRRARLTVEERLARGRVARQHAPRSGHANWKPGPDVDNLTVPGAALYARLCGATLARAHARWGDRIAIASYLGSGDRFDRAIAAFAAAYTDQNERDYAAFKAAVDSGRLVARTGLQRDALRSCEWVPSRCSSVTPIYGRWTQRSWR